MANLLKMMKQAASMQKDVKKIQKELADKTVEFAADGGRVKATARGDMSMEKIEIDPAAMDPSNPASLEKKVVHAVNGALAAAKEEAGKEMKKLTAGMGLPDMM